MDWNVAFRGLGVLFSFITLVVVLIKSYTDGKVFNKIQNNDLFHLSTDMQEIKVKVDDLGQRISKVEGKLKI